MAIAVLTDSTACIPKDLVDRYHIGVVPLTLIWGDKEYVDGVDITLDEFYSRLKTEEVWPITSGSVQGVFYDAFEELRGKVDGVVAVVLSSGFSAGYRSVLTARSMIEGLPVEIIDSTFSIGAEGLVATAATRAAVAGAGMEEVANAARSAISKMSSFLNVGSISYFLRLGRVDKSRVDSIEESHIVIFKDTKIVPYEKYPTKEESRRRLKELVKERVVKDTPLHVAISHAKAKKEAEEFKEWIQSQYDCAELWIGECTPVVAIHVSPESLAVAFYNE